MTLHGMMNARGARSDCGSQERRALFGGSSSERGASPGTIDRTKAVVRVTFCSRKDVLGVSFRSSKHRASQERDCESQEAVHWKLGS